MIANKHFTLFRHKIYFRLFLYFFKLKKQKMHIHLHNLYTSANAARIIKLKGLTCDGSEEQKYKNVYGK
jgi:hypothetical protein